MDYKEYIQNLKRKYKREISPISKEEYIKNEILKEILLITHDNATERNKLDINKLKNNFHKFKLHIETAKKSSAFKNELIYMRNDLIDIIKEILELDNAEWTKHPKPER